MQFLEPGDNMSRTPLHQIILIEKQLNRWLLGLIGYGHQNKAPPPSIEYLGMGVVTQELHEARPSNQCGCRISIELQGTSFRVATSAAECVVRYPPLFEIEFF